MKTAEVALGAILSLGLPLMGQEPPAAPAPGQAASPAAQRPERALSLSDALNLASQQNLELAAARQQRVVAMAGVRIARQIPNPAASFSVSRDAPHEGLLFEQPLEIGGQRARRVELANEEIAFTDVEISALERSLRRRVREAFYKAMAAQASTAQRAHSLELARRLLDIAKARFDAGDVPHLEVLQAELEVSRAETDLEVARQGERVSLAQLNALLNVPSETTWALVGKLEDALPALALPDLVGRGQLSNPEIQRIAAERRIEQRRWRLLRSERIPDVNLQFGADFNSPGDFRAGPRGGLAMTIPLFTRNQGELAQSTAIAGLLEREEAAARRAVAGRVEAAYYEWQTRTAQVDLYRRVLVPGAQRLEAMAEESYREGKASLLTVLDARRNVQQVEREYIDSLLEMQDAFAALEETVGASLD